MQTAFASLFISYTWQNPETIYVLLDETPEVILIYGAHLFVVFLVVLLESKEDRDGNKKVQNIFCPNKLQGRTCKKIDLSMCFHCF